jgi:hypothetical protein
MAESEAKRNHAAVGLGSFVLLVVLVGAIALCGAGGLDVTVESWRAGSADVTGQITNNGAACSDPRITLSLRDHNDAIVREFTFGAGEIAKDIKRSWKTHIVGFLMVDAPVESNVTKITASATCADKH